MAEIQTENAAGVWSVPACPFTIEYVPRVLDDIRLGVMDAFYSLPRGGAEIGGVLLGNHTEGRVMISDYLALDCEHATGPSFVLSERDEAKLRDLLDGVRRQGGLEAVGWYHSHTRSEVFLSETDLALHRRFFMEPWQVALVLKPHTFQPMRGGFFFREPGGGMHATATYQEFVLEAMPLRIMPGSAAPPVKPDYQPILQSGFQAGAPVINVAPEVEPVKSNGIPAPAAEPEPAPAPLAVPVPVEIEAPKFASAAGEPRSRPGLKPMLALCAILASAGSLYQTRALWLPTFARSPKTAAAAAPGPPVLTPASLALTAVDTEGQLQIRWDRSTPAVQQATGAILKIADGAPIAREIHLDPEHLRSGAFTYERESQQVDVSLTTNQPNGGTVRAMVVFVGKAPPKPVPADFQVEKLKADLAAAREQTRKAEKLLADRGATASNAAKTKADLAAQVDRNKKLEKSLSEAQTQGAETAKLRKDLAAANDRVKKLTKSLVDAQNEIKQQQRKRLGNQSPDTAK